jgi:hydrogenase maturation protease
MADLREQLQQLLQGRVCLMGLGNVAYGDDGFGVRLAEALAMSLPLPKGEGRGEGEASVGLNQRYDFFIAGTTPERWISRVADGGFDHLVFLDAVEFGGAPGSVVLLNSDEMAVRFPQISTHKLSLGLLAKQAEANGRTKAWLLGVQPESLRPGEELTPTVRTTLELLFAILKACLHRRSRGDEALTSQERWFKQSECLSLVTSAPTPTTEVLA